MPQKLIRFVPLKSTTNSNDAMEIHPKGPYFKNRFVLKVSDTYKRIKEEFQFCRGPRADPFLKYILQFKLASQLIHTPYDSETLQLSQIIIGCSNTC